MKSVHTLEHRQLLRRLTSARQRAELTAAELADKVTAGQGFVLRYESGARGSAASPKRASPARS